MNLKTHIKQSLWLAIANTYETENYSHAILDAIHYLSEVLREKSGVDGDGNPLVGKVLGGSSPVLRVNKLQTESERDVQKGLEHLLRGVYLGIRNPRSHEQIEDTKDTADAIIYFINYLLGILEQSKEPFTLSEFLKRAFDPDFVRTERYVMLLVKEIPLNRRLDTLIEIYRRKLEGDEKNVAYVAGEIISHLSDEQVAEFLHIVSDELKTIQGFHEIKAVFQVLPPELWPRINELSQLRIEQKITNSIREGRVVDSSTIGGALATWAIPFLRHFRTREWLETVILLKLQGDSEDAKYIFTYYLPEIPRICRNDYAKEAFIIALCNVINKETGTSYDQLTEELSAVVWPDDWRSSLQEKLPEVFQEQEEDDIPF